MCPIASRKVWLLVVLALPLAALPLQAGESVRGRELRHRLDETVKFEGIDDSRATLADALDQLSKRYNLTFDINDDAFNRDNMGEVGKFEIAQPPIPPMQTSLGKVLGKVLRHVSPSATFLIRGDAVEITTTEAIRQEFFADRPTTPGPLPPLVTGEFDKVPLEVALKELNRHGNVVLDVRSAKEGQTPVTADLSNVPLDTAVRMLGDMAGLKVVKLDNSLYVTSKDNAKVLLKEQDKQKREREREDKENAKKEEEKPKTSAPKTETDANKKVS